MENNRKEIEYIDRYLAYCETRSVPAKTVVIETGEVSDSLFYILEGTLTVSVTDESGREMILAYLSEGEFLASWVFMMTVNNSAVPVYVLVRTALLGKWTTSVSTNWRKFTLA